MEQEAEVHLGHDPFAHRQVALVGGDDHGAALLQALAGELQVELGKLALGAL